MTDQRPMFRFRLPWLAAAQSTPASQPPAQPTTKSAPAPTRPTISGNQSSLQPPTSTSNPAIHPATETRNAAKLTTVKKTTITPTSIATQRPPLEPPGVAPPQASSTQTQAARKESQPTSTSPQTTQASAIESPTSRPSSSSRAGQQSQVASPRSSLSGRASQLSQTLQPTSQPRSPSHLESHLGGQTNSHPQSVAVDQRQVAVEITTQPPSPSKELHDQTKVQPDMPPKSEIASLVSESQALQPNKETTFNTIHNSHNQANETSLDHSNISRHETTLASTTSKGLISSVSSEPQLFISPGMNTYETKEVKEMVQETESKAHEVARSVFKSDQMQMGKQEAFDKQETVKPIISNSKHATRYQQQDELGDAHEKITASSRELKRLHQEIKDDISKFTLGISLGDPNNVLDERPVSVITLAGENRGASMQLGHDSSKREGAIHIHRGYKSNPDESAYTTTDGEGTSKIMKSKDDKTIEDQTTEAYINSNAQGINNSVMVDCSISEQNPGIHVVFPSTLAESPKSVHRNGSTDTRKAEFNVTHAEKLTYEPTIRRRCLRGLFLESSDSDPDNPNKPRHHGCRVGCKQKSNEIKPYCHSSF